MAENIPPQLEYPSEALGSLLNLYGKFSNSHDEDELGTLALNTEDVLLEVANELRTQDDQPAEQLAFQAMQVGPSLPRSQHRTHIQTSILRMLMGELGMSPHKEKLKFLDLGVQLAILGQGSHRPCLDAPIPENTDRNWCGELLSFPCPTRLARTAIDNSLQHDITNGAIAAGTMPDLDSTQGILRTYSELYTSTTLLPRERAEARVNVLSHKALALTQELLYSPDA